MFENEVKEILDLVFQASVKTDKWVSYSYDSNTKILGVITDGDMWAIGDDKNLQRNAEECKDALHQLIRQGVADRHLEALKELSSADIAKCINGLLEELDQREDYIFDYENPGTALNRIEYHAAEGKLPNGSTTPAVGDGTDNLYCFFEEA